MTIDIHNVRRITIKHWRLSDLDPIQSHVLVMEIEQKGGHSDCVHLFTVGEPSGDFPRVIYDADHATPVLPGYIDPVTVMPVEVK